MQSANARSATQRGAEVLLTRVGSGDGDENKRSNPSQRQHLNETRCLCFVMYNKIKQRTIMEKEKSEQTKKSVSVLKVKCE